MAVTPPRERAERSVDDFWSEGVRFIVFDSPPMAPGRGRKRSPPKGRRLDGSLRFDAVLDEVFLGLRTGSLDAESAQALVCAAGFDEFIRIAGSREEVVKALAHFYEAGLEFWSEDTDKEAGICRAMFMQTKHMT